VAGQRSAFFQKMQITEQLISHRRSNS
jgi:hypothetical protein